jgi:hypothetical protein
MATAIYIAERALKQILVQGSDAPFEADEYQDFYDAMNDFMADLDARGVNLGYTNVSGPDDVITIPDGAIRGLIANMAIESAPDYEATVSPALIQQAQVGMRTMRRLGQKRVQVAFPSTLPRGAGNAHDTYLDDTFYRRQGSALLTLTGNTVATVITTQDVPVRVAGYWDAVKASGLIADINGRVRNSGQYSIELTVDVSIEVTGGTTATVHLYENGSESLGSVSGAADGTSLRLVKSVTLLPNEYLELWVENDTGTENLTIRDCQWKLS